MRLTATAMMVWMAALSTAQAASIRGTIAPADQVAKIEAILRGKAAKGKLNFRRFPGKFGPVAGTFTIDGLADGTYDLAVTLAATGAVIEGVSLEIEGEADRPSYTLNAATRRIATRNFDVTRYFDPDAVVSEDEKLRKTLVKLRIPKLDAKIASILKAPRFTNRNRPLWLHGTRENARVLMELVRDRKFHSGKDEIILRIEVWPFHWAAGGWDKSRKGVVVIDRVRTTRQKYEKMTRLFDPALGGLKIADNKDITINYELPAKLDASMGVVPPAGPDG